MEMKALKELLTAMKFSPVSGTENLWEKLYSMADNYRILVKIGDAPSSTHIDYGNKIICGRTTTMNVSQPETMVVLECVNRLLEKGYHPDSIQLEKGWRVGGYLDIYVTDLNNDGYLMIECKQYGEKYNVAKEIILTNDYKKEQLFNYFLNDKNPKFLLLYSSMLSDTGNIIYQNDIIETMNLKHCATQEELYNTWDKNFISKAIFEEGILPYQAERSSLLKRDLQPLDVATIKVDGKEGSIYNLFAEILRRYTVSDKSNAYDKIFNMFLCKIVDEDKTDETEELEFQWKETDTAETVLTRLNDLYTKGMNEYLSLHVADITEEDFEKELRMLTYGMEVDTSRLQAMFREIRLYKNTTFAFREIIDKKAFEENAEIVKAVVLLLQKYRIRYNHKQRYLSEFFERLLNIGIKQEAGQFFTPVPIAEFVCNAIDVENIIRKKVEGKEGEFLPYTIDFACGSGHFITSMMDRIDDVVKSMTESEMKTKIQKDNLHMWGKSYKWAKTFMYGVEKDYRLAKTTKVASFLNGDGDANIFYADGLESFSSTRYTGLLHRDDEAQDNEKFDILVANPPYTVADFKQVLYNANRDFLLASEMTDKSDDIECLFIERAKQLLRSGGRCGIILPTTILFTGSHYQRARALILKHFKIRGIVEFGKNTFALTGQNTVALFLEKRPTNDALEAEKCVDKFFETFADYAFDGQENIIEKFVQHTACAKNKADYLQLVNGYSEQRKKTEKERLFYFTLAIGQKVVVTHYGNSSEEEKIFLGYEHSSMKNYEGIHPYPYREDGKIVSVLYNPENEDDKKTISVMIRDNFLGELEKVPFGLENHVQVKMLNELLEYTEDEFAYKIYVTGFDNPFLKKKDISMITIKDLEQQGIIEILDSMRKPVKKSKRGSGIIPYYGANGQTGTIDDYIFDEELLLVGEDGARWGTGEETAYIISGKAWVNNHVHVLRVNREKMDIEYLALIFRRFDFSYLKSRPNGGKLLQGDMKLIAIPNIEMSRQKELIQKCKKASNIVSAIDTYFGI